MEDIRGGYQEEEAFERALNDEARSQGNLGSPGETESKWEGKRTERTGGKRITQPVGLGVEWATPALGKNCPASPQAVCSFSQVSL